MVSVKLLVLFLSLWWFATVCDIPSSLRWTDYNRVFTSGYYRLVTNLPTLQLDNHLIVYHLILFNYLVLSQVFFNKFPTLQYPLLHLGLPMSIKICKFLMKKHLLKILTRKLKCWLPSTRQWSYLPLLTYNGSEYSSWTITQPPDSSKMVVNYSWSIVRDSVVLRNSRSTPTEL